MEFKIQKNEERRWNLIPLDGIFQGQVVAKVEGVSASFVRFAGTEIVGTVSALWGVEIAVEDVFEDPDTFRALCIGRTFKEITEQRAVIDRDGIKDAHTLQPLKGAKRVMLMGSAIYTRGQYT